MRVSRMMFGQIIDEDEMAERGAHVAILDLVADDLLRSWGGLEEGGRAAGQGNKWRPEGRGGAATRVAAREDQDADGACLLCFDEVQVSSAERWRPLDTVQFGWFQCTGGACSVDAVKALDHWLAACAYE